MFTGEGAKRRRERKETVSEAGRARQETLVRGVRRVSRDDGSLAVPTHSLTLSAIKTDPGDP